MAKKRMFSQTVTESDKFLEMPATAQNLYFHLSMSADDDGMLNNAKSIQRICNASPDDLKLLVMKNYLIAFDSGVFAITHWNINNTLKSDRYKATSYQNEFNMLGKNPDKSYFVDLEPKRNQIGTQMEPNWNPNGTQMEPNWNPNGTQMEPKWNHDSLSQKMDCEQSNAETLMNTDVEVLEPKWNPNGTQMEPQYSIGLDKDKVINKNIINLNNFSCCSEEQNNNDNYKIDINNKRAVLDYVKRTWNTLTELGIPAIREIDINSDRAFRLFRLLDLYGVESFGEAVDKIRQSKLLTGRKEGNKLKWNIDFKWILSGDNYVTVLEDTYTKDYGTAQKPSTNGPRNFININSYTPDDLSEVEAKLLEN